MISQLRLVSVLLYEIVLQCMCLLSSPSERLVLTLFYNVTLHYDIRKFVEMFIYNIYII